jgi:hypothetical protein
MERGEHKHTLRMGDMIRCTICHRQWQADEREDELPRCEAVAEDTRWTNDRFRQGKKAGWRGTGDHGGTKLRTRPSLRR